ncbi:zinc finger and SCAN domain-containing protein 10 isoform X1 [Gadus morhua]|uniref:zinc finger and SCAN domain-containing protein 10 isoform X1 n=1 Tax=Gadus morhua TaxID=8049 RepID=UPI0011B4D7D5|nr:zinc finger and SCAN domain-containing protein 10-like isoform X1 [Gadus morhua]
MSLEYTIDIQLTELGFPNILQTPVRETPCLLPSQYLSLSGSESRTTIPTKPTIRQQLENDPSVTRDKCSSPHTTDTSGSSQAQAKDGMDTSSRGSEDAYTFSVLPRSAAKRPNADVVKEPSGAETTKRLADQANDKSQLGANNDQEAKGNTQDAVDESADDSEESEDYDEESLGEDEYEFDGTGDYNCGVCGLQLPSNMKLQDHMNQHTGQRPHCCAECGKRFCQLNNYRAHLKTHAVKTPELILSHRCRICRKLFESNVKLREHLETTHFEKEFYECDLCKLVFTDRKKCEKHIEWHKSTLLVCDTCGREFSSQESLQRHRNSKCRRSFVCTDCNQTFSRKNALLKHSFSHIGLLPYTCLLCSCHFRLAHLYRQHNCDPQRIHCVACLKVFASQRDFQQHKKDTGCWGDQESNGDEIRCPECGKVFATKEELKKHGSAHQRILTCDDCGKGFRSALLLMSHMGGHVAQSPCLCQRCGRGFSHQCDYDSHLERCGLAPLPPIVSKKRAQKSSAQPGNPTLPHSTEPPITTKASTSGWDPNSGVATISSGVPAPSPEDTAQGSWRLTLDHPPPLGLNLILFVPVNSTLASGLLPKLQETGPPAPMALDAAVGLQKIIIGKMRSSVVGLPLEVDAPLDLVLNKKLAHNYGAPQDLSNKVNPFMPAVSIKTEVVETPMVSIETPAVDITTPGVSIKTSVVSIETEAVSIETEAVSIETEAVSIETEVVSIETEAVSTKSSAVSIKTPAVSIKTEALEPAVGVKPPAGCIQLATKECWVVLRKWSGKTQDITGDTLSCVNRKTGIREILGDKGTQ